MRTAASIAAAKRSPSGQCYPGLRRYAGCQEDSAGTLGIAVSIHKLLKPRYCVPVHFSLHETCPAQQPAG